MATPMTIINVPLSDIFSDIKFNCRGELSLAEILELAQDIHAHGLHQPIHIRLCSEDQQKRTDRKYSIIAGHCRYAAHVQLARQYPDFQTIACICQIDLSDQAAILLNLQENLKRRDLTIMQEANAIRALLRAGLGRESIAKEIGKSNGWVQIRTMLLKMSKEVHAAASANLLTLPQIRDLYTYRKDVNKQNELILKIKVARERGEKRQITLIPKRQINPKIARHRSKPEITLMRDHVQDTLGNNIITRVLAWTAGDINTIDFHTTLREFADEHGLRYFIPHDVIEASLEN